MAGETERCVYNKIVAEALTTKNHEYWSSCVRNYLIARDVWDVVDGTFAKPPEYNKESLLSWRRKNAAALHVILFSCGSDAFSHISEISEAKLAWNTLIHICNFNPPLVIPLASSQVRREEEDFDVTVLYKAIYDNNWEAAKAILDEHPSALTAELNHFGQTALHVAAELGQVGIVEELVRMVPPELLEMLDHEGFTPLSTAAATGAVTRIAECMVNKNINVLSIPISTMSLPVTLAFASGHKRMGRYLYFASPPEIFKPENGIQGPKFLRYCFFTKQLDIALDLLQQYKDLLYAKDNRGWSPIMCIAVLPFVLFSGSQLVFWKRWICNYINIQSSTPANFVLVDIEQQDGGNTAKGLALVRRFISKAHYLLGMMDIYEEKWVRSQAAQIFSLVCKNVSVLVKETDEVEKALFQAAREGNVEFVVRVTKAYPILMLAGDHNNKNWNIFSYAIAYRQAEVFNLIHGIRSKDRQASWADYSGNTLLHVAANLAPPAKLNRIAGPALQMQTELQWFKEVESLVFPWVREFQNSDGMKPKDIFKQNHKELRKEGEKWMKGTASSCSVVGALVVTIMFAAAFTVPGGNDQTSGFPIFLDKQDKLFMIFIFSDIISLFSSTTSVLMFLGILTSRYKEEDFLKSLPTKLIIGLSTLFLSIVTMVIAFSATILMMLQHRSYLCGHLPIIILASVPVAVFGFLQFPLLLQMVSSTYGPGIFNRKVKPWL